MVTRDEGPRGTLGFGVSQANLPREYEDRAAGSQGGALAQYFEDKPIAKFFATAIGAMLGGAAAGAMVRHGGTKMLHFAADPQNRAVHEMYSRNLMTFRKIQKTLDEYGGVKRTYKGDNPFSSPLDDDIVEYNFTFSAEERRRILREGFDAPEMWKLRDEYQTKLVRMARRAPYELTGAYIFDKQILHPALGISDEERKINITNPVDAIGDFANETAKNLAFGFLPFELGGTTIRHKYQKQMYRSSMNNTVGGRRAVANDVFVDLNTSLKLVGAQFGDLISQSMKYSRKGMGSLATAVTDTAQKTRGAVAQGEILKNSAVKDWQRRVKDGQELPTVFAQIRNVIDQTRLAWKGTPLEEGVSSIGTSRFERYVNSIAELTPRTSRGGNAVEASLEGGGFYNQISGRIHSDLFQGQLKRQGIDEKTAARIARGSTFNPTADFENTAFSRRFRFGQDARTGAADTATRIERAFGIDGKLSAQARIAQHSNRPTNVLEEALYEADDIFFKNKAQIDDLVKNAWEEVYENGLTGKIRSGLGARKAPYADFEGPLNDSRKNFLIRQSARRAGVDTDGASAAEVRRQLTNRTGIEADNYGQLRSFLVSQGDISKPWNPRGYNMLGFRAVTVQEGIESGYFDDSRRISEIKGVANKISGRGTDDAYLARQTKVGGLYRSESGQLVDFNPMIDSARKLLSVVGNEIKVPFIQVRSLQLFGLRNWEEAIEKGPIRFSANQRSELIGGDAGGGVFFFQGRGARGQLASMDMDMGSRSMSSVRLTDIEGKYAPISTRGATTQSELINLATGESGYAAKDPSAFRDGLNFAPEQESTLGNLVRRLRYLNEPTGVSGTAKKLLGSEDDFNQLLTDIDANEAGEFFNFLRRGGIAPAVRRYARQDGRLQEAFRGVYDDVNETQLLDAVRGKLDAVDTKTADPALRRLRRDIIGRYERMTESDLRTLTSSQRRVSRITTKADELRADLVRLQAIESGMNSQGRNFTSFIDEAMGELDDLYSAGRITAREKSEASLSLASMMQTYESTVNFNKSEEILSSYKQTLMNIRSEVRKADSGMREALQVAANRSDKGIFAPAYRAFSMSHDPRFIDYNVYPDDVQFVQSFATAFTRNPIKAIGSLMGIRSWGIENAGSFSLATMTTSNLATRLNRGLGFVGAKLDESQFRGPLDLMVRGMAGQRALPLTAAGAGLMAIDRTLGGLTNERDANGERVYSPLVMGSAAELGVRAQALGSGLVPGGLGYSERLEQLTEGEVPIRSGRYWILGNTPFLGGKVEYFGPSWYRRMQTGYQYTDQLYGSPAERMLYGYDFSPLRPLDPYRFEERTAEDRPYPESGDYFTGPYGPVTPILNATLGQVLKPAISLNPEAMSVANQAMIPQGQYGAAPAMWEYYQQAAGSPAYQSGSNAAPSFLAGINNRYTAAAYSPVGIPGGPDTRMAFTEPGGVRGPALNNTGANAGLPMADVETYLASAGTPAYLSGSRYASAMVMASNDPSNQIFRAGQPISASSLDYQASEFGYRLQEFAGIYGFGFSSLRTTLGFGNTDLNPERPVMASPSDAYGISRQFWEMNLGGMGDFPTPLEGQYANLEISELVRRFIPRPRDRTYNPIPNSMNYKAPWLPGGEGLIDFKTGDPYTKVTQGELRLPGLGYERLNNITSGDYDDLERLRILADVAPYSPQYRAAEASFRGSASEMEEVEMIRQQVEAQTRRYDFADYTDPEEMSPVPGAGLAVGAFERFKHMDTYFHRKFIAEQTALEHWERSFVYGSAFPEWSSPIESFVKPTVYKAGDRNPLAAATGMGLVGAMMGATHRARGSLRALGAVAGAGISSYQRVREAVSGDRYIPEDRRREVAFEQYADTLKYVKSKRNYEIAASIGDAASASTFRQEMKSTMYGADIYGSTAEELARALPKRKREHFMSFINEESSKKREQILSTSGVLERRIYQAAWGMKVEERPELGEYFEDKELPGPTWEGWSPASNMQDVILKSLQHEGLNASQMGYYPQELQQANLMNPSFPVFSQNTGDPRQRLNLLLTQRGMSGSVVARPSFIGGNQVNVMSGV